MVSEAVWLASESNAYNCVAPPSSVFLDRLASSAYEKDRSYTHPPERKERSTGVTNCERRGIMAKIKHIAIATQHEEETARFYIDTFGLTEIGKIDMPIVSGYFLSDGTINLAILHFKNDQVAGAERGKDWSGIHHIGFEVESVEEIVQKLAAAGATRREDINQALGLSMGSGGHGNAEVRYSGPDGVMFDVSQTGWVGTSGSVPRRSTKS